MTGADGMGDGAGEFWSECACDGGAEPGEKVSKSARRWSKLARRGRLEGESILQLAFCLITSAVRRGGRRGSA